MGETSFDACDKLHMWLTCQYRWRLSVCLLAVCPPSPKRCICGCHCLCRDHTPACTVWMSGGECECDCWAPPRHNKRLNVGRAVCGEARAVYYGTSAHLPAAASAADSSHSWRTETNWGIFWGGGQTEGTWMIWTDIVLGRVTRWGRSITG